MLTTFKAKDEAEVPVQMGCEPMGTLASRLPWAVNAKGKNPFLILFLLFQAMLTAVLGSAAGQQDAIQPIPKDKKPYLRDYVAPAANVRAGFFPYKAQLVWGEPFQVTFWVQNLGTNEFKFEFGGDYRGTGRHERFKITMTDAKGHELPDPIKHIYDMGGLLYPVNLKPGQVFTNTFDLPAYRVITNAGTYTVHCAFAFFDRRWLPPQRTSLGFPKEAPGLLVHSTFKLKILKRTPRRVAKVLDELGAKVTALQGQDLRGTLALLARFGQDDAVPRLAQLAAKGPVERRAAALGALSILPTDASLKVVLAGFKDAEPAIRVAAANSLGTMQLPRAVEALLDSLPQEQSTVTEAIVVALGTSKSDRAFPAITNALDSGELKLQCAAVTALANFGGPKAVAALTQRLNTNYLSLRYEIVQTLGEKLRSPIQAEWLAPVLAGRKLTGQWYGSLSLLRVRAPQQAIPTLLSGLDFEAGWSGRNWWILNTVHACPNAPPADYAYDPNRDGTPEEREKNLRTLAALKPLAGPIPALALPALVPPVPYLKTDPPIDFTPTFKDLGTHGIEIKSGFLSLTMMRNGSSFSYQVSDAYGAAYQGAARFRALVKKPERYAQFITPEQVKQLEHLLQQFAVKLFGSFSGQHHPNSTQPQRDRLIGDFYQLLVTFPDNCPCHGWHDLLFAYMEAPPGSLREQAKAALMDSVRVFSQNYHAGTLEFAEAAKKLFTPEQLDNILRCAKRVFPPSSKKRVNPYIPSFFRKRKKRIEEMGSHLHIPHYHPALSFVKKKGVKPYIPSFPGWFDVVGNGITSQHLTIARGMQPGFWSSGRTGRPWA
jgi:hypothetical protein